MWLCRSTEGTQGNSYGRKYKYLKKKILFIGTSLSSWNNKEGAFKYLSVLQSTAPNLSYTQAIPLQGYYFTFLAANSSYSFSFFNSLIYYILTAVFSLFPLPQTHAPTLTLEEEKDPTQPSIFNKQ